MDKIYILCKLNNVDSVNDLISTLKQQADIEVITDISEIPEEKRNDVKMLVEDEISKTISPQSLTNEYYNHMNEVLSSMVCEMTAAPLIEEICNDNISEYHKLSSFDKKIKNQARQKLEKQALKYQNRHYKK